MAQDVMDRGTPLSRGQGRDAQPWEADAGLLAWLLHAKGWCGVRVCLLAPTPGRRPRGRSGAAAFPAIPSSGGAGAARASAVRWRCPAAGVEPAGGLPGSPCPPVVLPMPQTSACSSLAPLGPLGAPCTLWLECHLQKQNIHCSCVRR